MMLLNEVVLVKLRGALGLRVATVMGAKRIELTGFSRHRGRAAQELRLLQRNHRLALAAVPALESASGAEALSRLFLLYPPLDGLADGEFDSR